MQDMRKPPSASDTHTSGMLVYSIPILVALLNTRMIGFPEIAACKTWVLQEASFGTVHTEEALNRSGTVLREREKHYIMPANKAD